MIATYKRFKSMQELKECAKSEGKLIKLAELEGDK